MSERNSKKSLSFTTNRQVRDEILSVLNSASSRTEFRRELKLQDRYTCGNQVVTACFEHPGGGSSGAEVMMVNLAAEGASLIYGGYMHPSTIVTLMIPNQSDIETPLFGSITFCDFLVYKYHAINIQWHSPIDPRDFIDPAQWIGETSEDNAQDNGALEGRILYLHSDNMELKLIQMMLSDTMVDVVWASDIGAALDTLHNSPFDIVFVDAGNQRATAVEEIARIRSEIHRGPIVVGVQDGNQSHIKELRRLGYKHFIQKPFEKANMLAVLGNAMQKSDDPAGGTSPIYSDIESCMKSSEWISDYIDVINKQAKMLDQSIKVDDAELALKICSTLHATGTGYGFPLLSEVAAEAITVLNASCSAKESRTELKRLLAVLSRLNVKQSTGSSDSSSNEAA